MRLIRRPNSQERLVVIAESPIHNLAAKTTGGEVKTLEFAIVGDTYRYIVVMTPEEWKDLRSRLDAVAVFAR